MAEAGRMEPPVTGEGDGGAPSSQGDARMRSIVQWFGAAFCILAITTATAWAVDLALPYGINARMTGLDRGA